MKKMIWLFVLIFLASIIITGCSNSNDSQPKSKSEANTSNDIDDNKKGQGQKEKKKHIYQIGEAANTESNNGGYPYAITVNSFEIINDDSANGVTMEDAGYTEDDPDARFAVVNVTIKNTGDKSFVPNEVMEAQIESEATPAEDDYADITFKERDKELAPGNEVTGDLVFASNYFLDTDKLYFIYEYAAVDNEIKFELPVKEQ